MRIGAVRIGESRLSHLTGTGGAVEGFPDDVERTRWFLHHILPHEPALRAWLGRRHSAGFDVDDIVQESYAILAERERLDDIHNPRAYLFQVAQSLVVRNIRRARIVPILAVEDLGRVEFADGAATPEESALERDELRLLAEAIASMPGRTREAFVLRRVHDLPQREIATRMGLSESTVEKHIARGIRWLGEWAANGGNLPVRTSRQLERDLRQTNGRTRNQS
ncbi:sigma-70 family RNA polymerase sigma factor [Pseudoxanthomonas putridarboris]|uniref:Sigma-70 family RNA polymerase sigma factor n=1 Tax=Pseudoxanthomonas putridarboris TaxID=752605 RepID=A0ABU9IXH1_9GAMM